MTSIFSTFGDETCSANLVVPAPGAAESLLYRALDKGLSFKISMGSVINLSPPLTISETDLDRALDILEACIGEVCE